MSFRSINILLTAFLAESDVRVVGNRSRFSNSITTSRSVHG
jgi:hypothetical protein